MPNASPTLAALEAQHKQRETTGSGSGSGNDSVGSGASRWGVPVLLMHGEKDGLILHTWGQVRVCLTLSLFLPVLSLIFGLNAIVLTHRRPSTHTDYRHQPASLWNRRPFPELC